MDKLMEYQVEEYGHSDDLISISTGKDITDYMNGIVGYDSECRNDQKASNIQKPKRGQVTLIKLKKLDDEESQKEAVQTQDLNVSQRKSGNEELFYENGSCDNANGNITQFQESPFAHSMNYFKVENVVSCDEVFDAIENIPISPRSSLKEEQQQLTPCPVLPTRTILGENTISNYQPASKVQVFATPHPRGRGRPRMSTPNVQKPLPMMLPRTPFPHTVYKKDVNEMSHALVPEWSCQKVGTPLQQTSQPMNVVFDMTKENGPGLSPILSTSGSSFNSSLSEIQESTSSSNFSSNSSLGTLFTAEQCIVGLDGEPMSRYESEAGMVQYFIPMSDKRETHNIKERKRRSRVATACNIMRTLVPGVSEKTDKASVFEHAVDYVSFIKNMLGKKMDQVYLETLYHKV